MIGHRLSDILDSHVAPAGKMGAGHRGLFETVNNSLHFQLGLALASVGTICSLVAKSKYWVTLNSIICWKRFNRNKPNQQEIFRLNKDPQRLLIEHLLKLPLFYIFSQRFAIFKR